MRFERQITAAVTGVVLYFYVPKFIGRCQIAYWIGKRHGQDVRLP